MDNIAQAAIYYALDKTMFGKVKHCKSAKQIWEKIEMICEGSGQIKQTNDCCSKV